jgi:hypothetical protein
MSTILYGKVALGLAGGCRSRPWQSLGIFLLAAVLGGPARLAGGGYQETSPPAKVQNAWLTASVSGAGTTAAAPPTITFVQPPDVTVGAPEIHPSKSADQTQRLPVSLSCPVLPVRRCPEVYGGCPGEEPGCQWVGLVCHQIAPTCPMRYRTPGTSDCLRVTYWTTARQFHWTSGKPLPSGKAPDMFITIYTLCWLAIWLISCLYSYFLGRLPVRDTSNLPWVLHRSYTPDTTQGRSQASKANGHPIGTSSTV